MSSRRAHLDLGQRRSRELRRGRPKFNAYTDLQLAGLRCSWSYQRANQVCKRWTCRYCRVLKARVVGYEIFDRLDQAAREEVHVALLSLTVRPPQPPMHLTPFNAAWSRLRRRLDAADYLGPYISILGVGRSQRLDRHVLLFGDQAAGLDTSTLRAMAEGAALGSQVDVQPVTRTIASRARVSAYLAHNAVRFAVAFEHADRIQPVSRSQLNTYN